MELQEEAGAEEDHLWAGRAGGRPKRRRCFAAGLNWRGVRERWGQGSQTTA